MRVRKAILWLMIASPLHAQEALNETAARAWYSGITVGGTTADGQTFRAYHSPDGKVRALVAEQYGNEGPWSVKADGSVCVNWRDWTWGKHPCYWIKPDGDNWKLERVDDSKNVTRVKRLEGNVYNM